MTSRLTMNGGTVEGTSVGSNTFGIFNSCGSSSYYYHYLYVYGGTVTGGTYGINILNANTSTAYTQTYVGKSNDALTTTSPVITGGTYGVYNYSGKGAMYFYNGILRGGSKGFYGDSQTIPSGSRTGCSLVEGKIKDNGKTYNTLYWTEGSSDSELTNSTYSITKDDVTTGYATFNQALAAAGDGTTIKMLKDNTDSTTITIDKDIYLDTNDKVLTRKAAMTINSGKTLTIQGAGTIIGPYSGGMITNNGTLNIVGDVTISNTNDSYRSTTISNNGVFKMNAGTVIGGWAAIYDSNTSVSSSIEITGGKIDIPSGYGCCVSVHATDSSYPKTFTMTGGTLTAPTYPTLFEGQYTTAKIFGGTITGDYAIDIRSNAKVYIGNIEEPVSTSSPMGIGGYYAVNDSDYNAAEWYFYNGSLSFNNKLYSDIPATEIREGYEIRYMSVRVNGKQLTSAYLYKVE